ncbi:MAG: porin [Burkholderiales bacterium]|nr:porin [Burkholderiales bacterium]
MKKSLLALAVLGAFAGAASAQSSVTIYGKLNIEAGKAVASTDKSLMDVAGSRLGFRGVEDLGGGLKATFGMEHRFSPQDGQANARFWNGYSKVGLQGNFGHIQMGRDYVVGFLMVQNQIDPFGGDTQAALRGVGMLQGGARVRYESQIEYHLAANGFNLAAQVADSLAGNGGVDGKAFALAANYAAGPLFVGLAYENGSDDDDKQVSFGARYNFGFATLSAGLSKGTNAAGVDGKGWLIGANVPVGAGDFKIGFANGDNDAVAGKYKKIGIGYHYNLSKRTKVFADYAKVSGDEAVGPKTGYDFGIQHNF